MKLIKTTPNFLPIKKVDFTREQLIEMYDEVFLVSQSDGFKASEIKDLLFNNDYWFMEQRKDNWEEKLKTKLIEFGVKI